MIHAFITLTALLAVGCSSDSVQSLPGPIALDESSALQLEAPFRATGLFHQICFVLPAGYEVGEDFHSLVTPSGESLEISVRMKAQSGEWFEFDSLSSLRQPEIEFACLSSLGFIGRQSEMFTKVEVASSIPWSTPEVRWLSLEKL